MVLLFYVCAVKMMLLYKVLYQVLQIKLMLFKNCYKALQEFLHFKVTRYGFCTFFFPFAFIPRSANLVNIFFQDLSQALKPISLKL